ncbi:MAG: RagB/SusD family nutrient uptake outer membrane protein [Bacteroidales bacterium]|nr:RagB/SusD family nutrient uptake outer membrane protein [Bacteroidales bacterium]
MKKIFKLLAVTAISLSIVSCGKDYLQTSPTSSTGSATIFESADNIALAVNGMYRVMVQQYGYFGQGYNGEGTIKFYIGDFGGNNFNLSGSGNVALMSQNYHDNDNSTFILYSWLYYYRLISEANSIISGCDNPNLKGSKDQAAFYKAQALTMRAYAFTMLTQMFHRRWSDNMNSEARDGNGLVLRLEPTTSSMKLSSAEDTYKQIYNDLDSAIVVLEKEYIKRDPLTQNYMINADVAYAVYARAAITRHDYETARKYAQKASKNYTLMTNDDYLKGGWSKVNKEWIWSSYCSETQPLYYYSFFAYVGFNCKAAQVRNYPKCMSKHLYDQIPTTDIRRDLFLDPKDMKYSDVNGSAAKNSDLYNYARKIHPELTEAVFTVAAYMNFKFASESYSYGHLNHFRAAEMYLIEAECDYFLKDEDGARTLLNKLNRDSKRDPSYNCTASGEALLKEIKLYRGIELWGEGFEWFDLKRWNDGISRKSFKEGGNWSTTYAYDVTPDKYNGWTNVLPKREKDYNDAIGK